MKKLRNMDKIKITLELEYDPAIMHGGDPAGIEWFKEIIEDPKDELILHSNELGDTVGFVSNAKIISIY